MLILFQATVNAQSSTSDSLIATLTLKLPDTVRINTLNEIGWQLMQDAPNNAKKYLAEAISRSKKIKFSKGEADAYVSMAVIHAISASYDTAFLFYQKALDIRKSIGDTKGIGNIYNNLGNLYDEKGDFFKSIENYQLAYSIQKQRNDAVKMGRASYNISTLYWRMGNYPKALESIYDYLSIMDKIEDKEGIARAYNQLGNIHVELIKPEKAMEYYQTALKYWVEVDNQEEQANTMNNLGSVKDDLGKTAFEKNDLDKSFNLYQAALVDLQKSLDIRIQHKNESGKAEIFNNLGVVYKNLGTYYQKMHHETNANQVFNQALSYFQKSLDIRKKLEDKKGIIEVYNGFGDVYRRLKDYKKALFYTMSYKQLADEIGESRSQQMAYKDLASLYYSMGNYKQAYDFRLKYEDLKDLRVNESNMLKYQQDEFSFKEGKKQREIENKQNEIALQNEKLKSERTMRNSLLGGAIMLSLLAMLLYNRNRIKTRSNSELKEKNFTIEKERKRSDELLLNILPEATANELKTTGKARARKYDSVSVLFTDFKNFTQIAEKLSAEELVAELDLYFRKFDEITEKHHIEKIKTIGDAYMCAGGIPEENKTHPTDAVLAGLEMIDFLENLQRDKIDKGLPYFQVRIGIHTGPIVAGVVGTKKFAYDIWGDTVNLAARMESSGAPGKLNISQTTYELVKDRFECTHRGKIEAKNKGQIDMYFVEQIKSV